LDKVFYSNAFSLPHLTRTYKAHGSTNPSSNDGMGVRPFPNLTSLVPTMRLYYASWHDSSPWTMLSLSSNHFFKKNQFPFFFKWGHLNPSSPFPSALNLVLSLEVTPNWCFPSWAPSITLILMRPSCLSRQKVY
jgi:hypothetical protein